MENRVTKAAQLQVRLWHTLTMRSCSLVKPLQDTGTTLVFKSVSPSRADVYNANKCSHSVSKRTLISQAWAHQVKCEFQPHKIKRGCSRWVHRSQCCTPLCKNPRRTPNLCLSISLINNFQVKQYTKSAFNIQADNNSILPKVILQALG